MLEDGDARPALPPLYNLTVQVPFELLPGFGGGAQKTITAEFLNDIAPSTGALSYDTNEFGAGLWLLQGESKITADFANAGNSRISLVRASDGTVMRFANSRATVANTEYIMPLSLWFLIRESHFIRHELPGTGAGQNIYHRGGVVLSRYL